MRAQYSGPATNQRRESPGPEGGGHDGELVHGVLEHGADDEAGEVVQGDHGHLALHPTQLIYLQRRSTKCSSRYWLPPEPVLSRPVRLIDVQSFPRLINFWFSIKPSTLNAHTRHPPIQTIYLLQHTSYNSKILKNFNIQNLNLQLNAEICI